jgi:outer membrane protein OmpA-like peptidoglycan-associated protein
MVSASLHAGGKREEPSLTVTTSGTQYISPDNNQVQDSAVLNFKVELYVKSKKGYVPEYGVAINDSTGKTVKEVVKTEKSDIGWFIRLFTKYSKFTLEKSIEWDGKNKDGKVVADGTYNAKIWIKDPAGLVREAELDNFIVDLVKPEVTLRGPLNPKFSPDNDGSNDFYEINHTGSSKEHLWVGEIYSSDNKVVKKYEWEGMPPERLIWDGKDNDGMILDDGEYTYKLNSTDLAGNKMEEKTIEGIILDTRTPEIIFRLSDHYVSPNNDGSKDTIVLTFGHNDPEGLESWEVFLADESGDKKAVYTGSDPGMYEAVFDGLDSNGVMLPDGEYNAGSISIYDNGARIVHNEKIVIDTVMPKVTVNISSRVISPGRDEPGNSSEISFKSDEIVTWKGIIKDSSGSEVVETSDEDSTSLVVWEGMDDSGNYLPDGDYFLSASFTDRAGNTYNHKTEKIAVKRIVGAADILVIPGIIRLLEGNDNSGLYFKVISDPKDDIASWKFDLKESSGKTALSENGASTLPDHIFWDGKDGSEGFYSAEFRVVYNNGGVTEKKIDDIYYDLTAPLLDLDAASSPFVDEGGSYEGEVNFILEIKENYKLYGWEIVIRDSDGQTVITLDGEGDPEGYVDWYGETENNYKLESGAVYTATARVADMAGNIGTAKGDFPIDIALVKRDGKYYINTENIIFAAYKSSIDSRGRETANINRKSLKRVADLMKAYPDYTVVIEGHALNVLLGAGSAREKKEEAILEKLTADRAESVRKELLKLGVPESSLKTESFGGKQPIAPVKDMKERWKNRRAVFVVDMGL